MFRQSYRLILGVLFFIPMVSSAAIIEVNFVEYDNATVTVHYTYDNTTNKVQQVIVVDPITNTHSGCGYFRKQGASTYQAVLYQPSATPTIINVPQNGANSVTVTINSKGRPEGIDGGFAYPFDKPTLNPGYPSDPTVLNPCQDY